MQKKVVAVIGIIAVLAAVAYGSYLCGVESQRGTITQITTELENVKRDKQTLVGTIKRNNLQNYFYSAPLPLRTELSKPLTLGEQSLFY